MVTGIEWLKKIEGLNDFGAIDRLRDAAWRAAPARGSEIGRHRGQASRRGPRDLGTLAVHHRHAG